MSIIVADKFPVTVTVIGDVPKAREPAEIIKSPFIVAEFETVLIPAVDIFKFEYVEAVEIV